MSTDSSKKEEAGELTAAGNGSMKMTSLAAAAARNASSNNTKSEEKNGSVSAIDYGGQSSASAASSTILEGSNGNRMMISPLKSEGGPAAAAADITALGTSGLPGEKVAAEGAGEPNEPAMQQAATSSTTSPGAQAPQAQPQQGALFASQLQPQNPYAALAPTSFGQPSMMFSSALLHQSTANNNNMLLHPQFRQMHPQQQALVFQQHLMMQQMAHQSLQQHLLQQSLVQQQQALTAEQQQQINMSIEQQLLQQSIQQQLLQQSQFQAALAAAAAAASASAANATASAQQSQPLQDQSQAQGSQHVEVPAPAAAALPQQQQQIFPGQAPAHAAPYLQAAQFNLNPLYWSSQHPQGIPASGIEAIYQADESNYQVPPNHPHHDDSDEDDDDNPDRPSGKLLRLVEDHHWVAALQRIVTHPRETQQVGIQGRTPLHVACDHDAPAALVQALLNAWPEGAERVGTSHMNPLHITCSSPHASVDVVRVLLAGCRDSLNISGAKDVDGDTPLHAACRCAAPMDVLVTLLQAGCRDSLNISGAKDVDGDTPLHAACRCAAPMDVLVTLLQANPITVTWKDYEGLNPLMRLWVRYFVLVGEQIISNIKNPSDLNDDLVEAWQKSLLLLQVMSAMERRPGGGGNSSSGHPMLQQQHPFRTVHAASSVDCPRCVVRIAMVLFPQELLRRDERNRLPIHIAAAAPVYAVHDLRGEGFTLDDAMFDDFDPSQQGPPPANRRRQREKESQNKYKEPSVIDILLSGESAAASERDPQGQLPLHVAIMRGKTLDEGVQALVEAHPDALTTPDNQTNLYPFMLAASVGRGRGDCSTIYALLRAAPELVHMTLTGEDEGSEEKRVKTPEHLEDSKPKAISKTDS